MATQKELAEFIGITESGIKYKKKHNPAEFLLIKLGYKYLHQLSSFDRGPILIRLANDATKANRLKEEKRLKAKAKKEGV